MSGKVQSKVKEVTYSGRHVESLYEIEVICRQVDKTQVDECFRTPPYICTRCYFDEVKGKLEGLL
jgi:hypothetical protein